MLAFLADAGIGPEPPQIPASRAIHASLTFIEIAIQELKPKYMSAYGPVTQAAAETLERFVEEVAPLVRSADRVVSVKMSENIAAKQLKKEA
jgi:hypothetical protein